VDLSAFFGVVATVDFALLGLWWVAVQARRDLRDREFGAGKTAYLVSLQFLVPGTAALLAQINPGFGAIWRIAFALAGASGLAAIIAIAPQLSASGEGGVALLLHWFAVPLQMLITVIALFPQIIESLTTQMSALEVEAVLFCLMLFLSAQSAWAAAMQPERAQRESAPAEFVR
jgi:cytochrome bd-type quinol oxidase subunit 2